MRKIAPGMWNTNTPVSLLSPQSPLTGPILATASVTASMVNFLYNELSLNATESFTFWYFVSLSIFLLNKLCVLNLVNETAQRNTVAWGPLMASNQRRRQFRPGYHLGVSENAIYIHTYIHACMHACMHTYIHTYIQTHTHRQTDGRTDGRTDRQTDIHTYTSTYIHIHLHTYIYIYIHTYTSTYIHTYIHLHTYIHTYIHTDTHTDRQTDRQTDGRTDRQTDRQTYIHTYIYIHTYTPKEQFTWGTWW